jgi:hypothetical protein
MPRFSRCRIVLLLVLLLLPAVVQAAEPRRAAEPLWSTPSGLIAWDVLARVWGFLTGAPSDNGCRLDPDGRCLQGQSAAPTADNGCGADPDGRCLPGQSAAPTADNGCWADPNGRCLN